MHQFYQWISLFKVCLSGHSDCVSDEGSISINSSHKFKCSIYVKSLNCDLCSVTRIILSPESASALLGSTNNKINTELLETVSILINKSNLSLFP